MKSEELQIGDWVCAACITINGEERLTPPMRVVVIGETWVHLLSDPEAGDPDEYNIEDIRPIPLTLKILRIGGFKKLRGNTMYMQVCDDATGLAYAFLYAYHYRFRPTGIEIQGNGQRIGVRPKYVHQLQHALRLAGVKLNIILHADNK